ncbi:MAG: DUF2851 family protein [Chlorobiota bacterium]|nr:DUF2851 family protein [Chlorobiota bacterium]QQS67675.1 MAG: DUF2851 family protein [Chlorobiota bacterium]
MNEKIQYYDWINLVKIGDEFISIKKEKIIVISKGERNYNAGPDFSGGILLINGELKIGSIEFHIDEKDWFLHSHHLDQDYDKVILHVIHNITSKLELSIPTIYDTQIKRLDSSNNSSSKIVINNEIKTFEINELSVLSWERFLNRTTDIVNLIGDLTVKNHIYNTIIVKLFDALGFSQNRSQMKVLAELVINDYQLLKQYEIYDLIIYLVKISGISIEDFYNKIPNSLYKSISNRIQNQDKILIYDNCDFPRLDWNFNTRSSNSPYIRIIAAAFTLERIYNKNFIKNIFENLIKSKNVNSLLTDIQIELFGFTFIGSSRAKDIVINTILPTGLASGIFLNNKSLIESSCIAYRNSFSLESNSIIRKIENKFLNGSQLKGAFYQQGAIEYYQRYYK